MSSREVPFASGVAGGCAKVKKGMHLAVFLDDRISDWEAKGEILSGYFNPDGIFSRITILSLTPDRPQSETLHLLAGPAEVEYAALGDSRMRLAARTLGLRPWLLFPLLRRLFETARPRPDLIRGYGDGLAAVAAGLIGRKHGIPYVVSLHATPDPEIRRRYSTPKDRMWRWLLSSSVEAALIGARRLIAVYSPILVYLPPPARDRAVVIPNVVGCAASRSAAERNDAAAGLQLLWAGRLIPGRDPTPIIEALVHRPHDRLTIIGSGPLAESVRQRADDCGVSARVTMIASMRNAELVAGLWKYDAMVLRTDYQELAKPVMEAALAGLPVIINRNPSATLDEYRGFSAIFTETTAASYAAAFASLAGDPESRARIEAETRRVAMQRWNPSLVAKRLAETLTGIARPQ